MLQQQERRRRHVVGDVAQMPLASVQTGPKFAVSLRGS